MKERDALVSRDFVAFRKWQGTPERGHYVIFGYKRFKTPVAAKAARTRWIKEGIEYLRTLKDVMLYA